MHSHEPPGSTIVCPGVRPWVKATHGGVYTAIPSPTFCIAAVTCRARQCQWVRGSCRKP